jgi:hypothetical protein
MRPSRNIDERFLTLCAWCGAIIFDAPVGPNGEISHGICSVCESKFESDLNYEIAREELS